jgi:hypothetical protein
LDEFWIRINAVIQSQAVACSNSHIRCRKQSSSIAKNVKEVVLIDEIPETFRYMTSTPTLRAVWQISPGGSEFFIALADGISNSMHFLFFCLRYSHLHVLGTSATTRWLISPGKSVFSRKTGHEQSRP